MRVSKARFTEDRNRPVVSVFHVNTDRLIELVSNNPGYSGAGIAMNYGANSIEGRSRVNSRLATMTKAKKPKIKRIKQDGAYRYYPTAHLAGRPPKQVVAVSGDAPIVLPPVSFETNLVNKAKDFVWDTGKLDLKSFVEWVRSNG